MVSSIEVLDNKVNFLMAITEEIHREMNLNFDFNKFVIDNNLTSTQVVLIIKALTIMNYKRFNILNEYINEFKNDSRFDIILNDRKPTFNDFNEFLKSLNLDLDGETLLKSLQKQKIGENICNFLLEDKLNNWYNRAYLRYS